MPSEVQLTPPQPDFEAASFWKITNSKEEKDNNQEINNQNLISKNSEIQTPIVSTPQNQNNSNIAPIVLQNLLLVIVINLPPGASITKQQQQQPQLPSQQQLQS
ncbi:hypothetical protein G9A89_019252 [Geosiphon pyriformis]|nr:hypothetical protein G9A89_019252 [Geosiphon pyriformis]